MTAPHLLHRLGIHLLPLLFLSLLSVSVAQEPAVTLEGRLNPDGTLDPSRGDGISFDIEGWRMTLDSTGQPHFHRVSEAKPLNDRELLGEAVDGDATWDDRFGPPGINGPVFAMAVHNGSIYIGGRFSLTGSIIANNVVRWNGSAWEALDEGTAGPVYALAVQGNYLIAGGKFNSAGPVTAKNIARWNITTGDWSPLAFGAGVGISKGLNQTDTVFAIVPAGADLYIGGSFTGVTRSAGEVPANRIVRWNGASWATLASGTNRTVRSIALDAGGIYVGGDFSTAGDAPAERVARWDGLLWQGLGDGVNGNVRTLKLYAGSLYAGGDFTTAGTQAASRIARWDTTSRSWSAMGGGFSGPVHSIAIYRDRIYAGGTFLATGGATVNSIARFEGGSWITVNGGVGDNSEPGVFTLTTLDTSLYVGGKFLTAGTVTSYNVALWNGFDWGAIGREGNNAVNQIGANSGVFAVAIKGDDVFIGGDFTSAGGIPAARVARWNSATNSWSALGSGISSPGAFVRSMRIVGDDLYVGGIFSSAGGVTTSGIARWSIGGKSWSDVGGGLGGNSPFLFAMTSSGTDLYVAGAFTRAGSINANRVAKWNGSQWSTFGEGISGDTVYVFATSIAVKGNELYVGGNFGFVAGTRVPYIAHWDGSIWKGVGGGVNAQVSALLFSGNDLYAGGEFTQAGGAPVSYIARWNGTAWSPLGSGTNAPVSALADKGSGSIYVGGEFTQAGGGGASRVAEWNGTVWSPLGSGTNGPVRALFLNGSEVYAGGEFSLASGIKVSNITRFDGKGWSALGSDPTTGLAGLVRAVAVAGNDIYIGGEFTTVGGVRANNIARWDGKSWFPVGRGRENGLNGPVLSLATDGNELFVGGAFTTAGSVAAPFLARWDGSNWSSPGAMGGSNPWVFALVVDGNDLYAGGAFSSAGGVEAARVARWNRTARTWHALGDGIKGGSYYTYISALAKHGDDLYAGGVFTSAGTTIASNIARWDGSAWSSLDGYGTNGGVYEIISSGENLYVGGDFRQAGNISAEHIARWDGSGWHSLGSGINGPVYDLEIIGEDLYAGGEFVLAGTTSANGIARWDGSAWNTLGRGVTKAESGGSVYALAEGVDSSIYVGGDFTRAGSAASFYFGHWSKTQAAAVRGVTAVATGGTSLKATPNPSHGETTIHLSVPGSGMANAHFELRIYDPLGREVETLVEGPLAAGEYEVEWNGGDLPDGAYLCRFRCGEKIETRVIVLQR